MYRPKASTLVSPDLTEAHFIPDVWVFFLYMAYGKLLNGTSDCFLSTMALFLFLLKEGGFVDLIPVLSIDSLI